MESRVIQAAGAVLWRRLSDELIQVALIHRPRYDDWSFPKGKAETGESEISCAFREVLEETGYETVFGPELCKVEYLVGDTTKTVRYWSAKAVGEAKGVMDPEEVDQLIWVTIADAYEKVSREGDKEVLKNFEKLSNDKNQSQLFIETPYRNNKLLEDILQSLQNSTRLCIATDITLPTEYIKTLSINDWKKTKVDLHNRPTIFIIQKS